MEQRTYEAAEAPRHSAAHPRKFMDAKDAPGPFPYKQKAKLSDWVEEKGEEYVGRITYIAKVAWDVALDTSTGSLIQKIRRKNQDFRFRVPDLSDFPKRSLQPFADAFFWFDDFGNAYMRREQNRSHPLIQFLKDFFAPVIRPLVFVFNLVELLAVVAIGAIIGIPTLAVLVVLGALTFGVGLLTNIAKIGWGALQFLTSPLTWLIAGKQSRNDQITLAKHHLYKGVRHGVDWFGAAFYVLLYGGLGILTSLLIPLSILLGTTIQAVGIAASPLTTVRSLVRGTITLACEERSESKIEATDCCGFSKSTERLGPSCCGDEDEDLRHDNDGSYCFGWCGGEERRSEGQYDEVRTHSPLTYTAPQPLYTASSGLYSGSV